MKREVRTAILELIRREREGEIVDRKLVKEVVEVRECTHACGCLVRLPAAASPRTDIC